MSSLGNFTTGFLSQINNPDCSYLVGGMMGQLMTYRLILIAIVVLFLIKILDKLAFNPLLNWIKNKIYRKNKK